MAVASAVTVNGMMSLASNDHAICPTPGSPMSGRSAIERNLPASMTPVVAATT